GRNCRSGSGSKTAECKTVETAGCVTLRILFDLDGTLVESGPSITASIRATMKEIDGPELDDATLRAFIGPPLRNGFEDLAGLHGDQLEQAVAFYMNHQLKIGRAHV